MFRYDYNECQPFAKTKYSAGFDIVAKEAVLIRPMETVLVPTGVWLDTEHKKLIELRENAFFGLYIRSSIAVKKGLQLANGVGVIDLDYKDEIKVALRNPTMKTVELKRFEPIAQLVLQPHLGVVLSEFRLDYWRDGGFGSTDNK